MANILLTRSAIENQLTSEKLSSLGFSSISLPIISHQNLNLEITDQSTHIIITSKHAAGLLAKAIKHKVECWVVGKESAAILSKNPNIEVTGIAKNLQSLLEIISLVPEDEALIFFNKTIYYSGDVITHDLPSFIPRQIIYHTSYLSEIEPEVIEQIKITAIKYIFVYSKNCGTTLINLIHKHNLLPYLQDSALIAISPEVSNLFEGINLKRLHGAEPTFEHMIKILIEHEQQII
jgi:uroporphyrinogen-III synthase